MIIFVNGRRFEHALDQIDRQMVMAKVGDVDRVVLLLSDDDRPDEVLGNGMIPIRGGERFETVPRGTWGG